MPIKIHSRKKRKSKRKDTPVTIPDPSGRRPLSNDLEKNEQMIRALFKHCSDLVVRRFMLREGGTLLIVYLDGMVESKMLEENLLKPLLFDTLPPTVKKLSQMIEQRAVAVSALKTAHTLDQFADGLLAAHAGLIVDGSQEALLAELKGFQTRSVEEPMTEAAIRGPRDGFTESLRINTTLLRRRIRSSLLKFESMSIGKMSNTDVLISYIEGLAPEDLLQEVRNRQEYRHHPAKNPVPAVQGSVFRPAAAHFFGRTAGEKRAEGMVGQHDASLGSVHPLRSVRHPGKRCNRRPQDGRDAGTPSGRRRLEETRAKRRPGRNHLARLSHRRQSVGHPSDAARGKTVPVETHETGKIF